MTPAMTINPPGFRTIVLISIGFALMKLSGTLELRGDLQPFAESGVSSGRLYYHLLALTALLAALGCFIWALKRIFGKEPGGPSVPVAEPEKAPEYIDIYGETAFDPDAALARYLSGRGNSDPADAPAAKPGGFGRKGL
jgi:hypothetical protein